MTTSCFYGKQIQTEAVRGIYELYLTNRYETLGKTSFSVATIQNFDTAALLASKAQLDIAIQAAQNNQGQGDYSGAPYSYTFNANNTQGFHTALTANKTLSFYFGPERLPTAWFGKSFISLTAVQIYVSGLVSKSHVHFCAPRCSQRLARAC